MIIKKIYALLISLAVLAKGFSPVLALGEQQLTAEELKSEIILEDGVIAGTETLISANAYGGQKPYQYRFTAKMNGIWTEIQKKSGNSVCQYTFEKAGKYPVNVTVYDSAGKSVKSQKTLTVAEAQPLQAELILPEETVHAGKSYVYGANIKGGSKPYRYQFTARVGGKWITIGKTSAEPQCTYMFETPGIYAVNVTVTDGAGARAKSQKYITVEEPEEIKPLAAVLNVPEEIITQKDISFSADAFGGTGGYRYRFTLRVNGRWIEIGKTSAENMCTYSFETAGTYALNVTVYDSSNTVKKTQKNIQVLDEDSAQTGCPVKIMASLFTNRTADDVIGYYNRSQCKWNVTHYNDSVTNPDNYQGVASYKRLFWNEAELCMYERWY